MKLPTEYVDGIPVTCATMSDVLNAIDENIRNDRISRCISITNTESMYFAKRLNYHMAYIKDATFSFCDGIGVVIAAKAGGKRVWRLNGPVLVERCCEYGAPRQWRHFFYGGKPKVADLMSKRLSERFPGLITAGTYSPPFKSLTESEENEIIDMINSTKPDILWVGLGLLKQEAWIKKYMHHLQVPWLVGVGAAFDYHAGTARWAPKWIRRIGMEWLYRLCFEPRMFKRNVRSYVFMFQAIYHGLLNRMLTVRPR